MPFILAILLLPLVGHATDLPVNPDSYCGRLLTRESLARPTPFAGAKPSRQEYVRDQLWRIERAPGHERVMRFNELSTRLAAHSTEAAEHERWANQVALILFAHRQGWTAAAQRGVNLFAQEAVKAPFSEFAVTGLNELIRALHERSAPALQRPLALALHVQLRWWRARWPLQLVREARGRALEPSTVEAILRWSDARGPQWATAFDVRELVRSLPRLRGGPIDLPEEKLLSGAAERTALEKVLEARFAFPFYYLDAIRRLPAEYRPYAEEAIAWYTSAARRAAELAHERYAGKFQLPRLPGETLLQYAARLYQEPAANQNFDYAAALQKPLTSLASNLLGTFPDRALSLLGELEESPATTALYDRAFAEGLVPERELEHYGAAWEHSAHVTARYLYEHRQNREPEWEHLGRLQRGAAQHDPAFSAPPAEPFRTTHYLMRRQLNLILALARSKLAANQRLALVYLAQLPVHARPIPSEIYVDHEEEPFRSLGHFADGTARVTEFRPLDFTINAYLTVAEALPGEREALIRQALEYNRMRLPEDTVTLRDRFDQQPLIATTLRLAASLLSVGRIDESLRLQNRLFLLLNGVPEKLGDTSLASTEDYLSLRRFAVFALPARTIRALRAQGDSADHRVRLLREQLRRQAENLDEEDPGDRGELALTLLDAADALAGSRADRELADELWVKGLLEVHFVENAEKLIGVHAILARGLDRADVRAGLKYLLGDITVEPADFQYWRPVLFVLANQPKDSRLRRRARALVRAHYRAEPQEGESRDWVDQDMAKLLQSSER